MIRFVKTLHKTVRNTFRRTRAPHPVTEPAVAAWSEQLGAASAKLWVAACKNEGRNR